MNTDETIKAAAERCEMKDMVRENQHAAMSPLGDALYMALKPASMEEQVKNLEALQLAVEGFRNRHPVQNPATLKVMGWDI